MNVLIIPEDFRKDQYVLRPLVKRMLAEIGKPNAVVRVCQNPLLGGIDQATKWDRIKEVLDMYRGMVRVFLLLVDRDGREGRRRALDRLEDNAAGELEGRRAMCAETAWQEIEVWAIAGQDLPDGWNWREIRAETNPKEVYFQPLADRQGLTNEPGGGRRTLGQQAAANYRRVRSRCPEDIAALESRLRDWLNRS